MSDVWKIAAKTNASDMYQITKSMMFFGSDIMAANRLTNMCNQMSSSYDQIIDDQNEYITEIDAQINEIETLQKELDAKIKEQANSSRGTYRLTENFFRFWYAFGFANFSQLEDGDVDGVYEFVVEPALHEFDSFTFEDVCRAFLREMQKRNELPFRYAKMGRWTGKTTVRDEAALGGLRTAETEIDLLCIDRDISYIHIPYF